MLRICLIFGQAQQILSAQASGPRPHKLSTALPTAYGDKERRENLLFKRIFASRDISAGSSCSETLIWLGPYTGEDGRMKHARYSWQIAARCVYASFLCINNKTFRLNSLAPVHTSYPQHCPRVVGIREQQKPLT
jgi:hypothetical protein